MGYYSDPNPHFDSHRLMQRLQQAESTTVGYSMDGLWRLYFALLGRATVIDLSASWSLLTCATDFPRIFIVLGWLRGQLCTRLPLPVCRPLTSSTTLSCNGPSTGVLTSIAFSFPLSALRSVSSSTSPVFVASGSQAAPQLDHGWSAPADAGHWRNSCQFGHIINGMARSLRLRSMTMSMVGMLNLQGN